MLPILHRHLCDDCEQETKVLIVSKTNPKNVLNECPLCKREYLLDRVYPYYKHMFAKHYTTHYSVKELEDLLNFNPTSMSDSDYEPDQSKSDILDEKYIIDNNI